MGCGATSEQMEPQSMQQNPKAASDISTKTVTKTAQLEPAGMKPQFQLQIQSTPQFSPEVLRITQLFEKLNLQENNRTAAVDILIKEVLELNDTIILGYLPVSKSTLTVIEFRKVVKEILDRMNKNKSYEIGKRIGVENTQVDEEHEDIRDLVQIKVQTARNALKMNKSRLNVMTRVQEEDEEQ